MLYERVVIPEVSGSGGGGGKGGGSSHSPTEAPNTLQSKATAKFVDLLGEGQILGLVDGDKSIYFNKVPVTNPDGTKNHEGFSYTFRNGLADQAAMPGFDEISSEFGVGLRVRADTPIEYITQGNDLDAIIVTLQIPSLTKANKETGDVDGYQVSIAIDVRNASDAANSWVTKVANDTIQGKCTSPYERSYRIQLDGPGQWIVRMRRLSADTTDIAIGDQTFFTRVTEIIERKMTYANSCVAGITIDAEQFGTNVPERAYEIYGHIMRYPSNYDPATRTYTGLWNGTWNIGYTNNPAWVFLAIATNARYGVGLDDTLVDKWGLYQMAQYCDELVPDGLGGMEPRFQFNGSIATQEEAYKILQAIASMMRAIVFYSAGMVIMRQDRPHDYIAANFTKANIVGDFNYSSTAQKARHTCCQVQWTNPALGYERDYVAYEDREAMIKYGYNRLDIAAYGTTSHGQAYRLGKWAVTTDLIEGETCQFVAGWDGAGLMPGDIIEVADNHWATADFGGRVESRNTTGNVIKLDRDISFAGATSPELHLTLVSGPNDDVPGVDNTGRPLRRQVTYFSSPIVGYNATTHEVTLANAIPADRLPNETPVIWVFSKDQVQPRLFRIISVTEAEEKGQYKIVSLNYNPYKFAAIDSPFAVEIPGGGPYSDLPGAGKVAPPQPPLKVSPTNVYKNGSLTVNVDLSWGASPDYYLRGYIIQYHRSNENWTTTPLTLDNTYTLTDLAPGLYWVQVRAVSRLGLLSAPLAMELQIGTNGSLGKDLVYDIDTTEGSGQFTGQDAHIVWKSHPIVYSVWGHRAAATVNNLPSDSLVWDTTTSPQNPTLKIGTGLVSGNVIRIQLDQDIFTYTVSNPDPTFIATAVLPMIKANAHYTASVRIGSNIVIYPSAGVNNELPEGANTDPLFKRFVVKIYDLDTGTLLRTDYTREQAWTYQYVNNRQDALGISARRTFTVGISVEDINGNTSEEFQAVISNPPPILYNVTLAWNHNTVTLRYDQPNDPDFMGMLLWLSETSGFTADDAHLVYRGAGEPVLLVEPIKTYYVRYAFYDAFGETGLYYSAETVIHTPDAGDLGGINVAEIIKSFKELSQQGFDFDIGIRARVQEIYDKIQTNADSILALTLSQDQERLQTIRETYLDGLPVGTHIENQQTELEDHAETLNLVFVKNEDGSAVRMNLDQVWISDTETFAHALDVTYVKKSDIGVIVADETQARIDADTAEATARHSLEVIVQGTDGTGGLVGRIGTEESIRAQADAINAQRLTHIAVENADGSAATLQQTTLNVDSTQSMAQFLASTRSIFADAKAYNDQDWTLTTRPGYALNQRVNMMGAMTADGSAFQFASTTLKVDATQSMAEFLSTTRSIYGNAQAYADTQVSLATGPGSALSSRIDALGVQVGQYSGQISQMSKVLYGDGVNPGITAKYSLTVTATGPGGQPVVTGVQINSSTTGSSEFYIIANKFAIVSSLDNTFATQAFQYINNTLYVPNAIINNISATAIKAQTITANQIVANNLSTMLHSYHTPNISVTPSATVMDQISFNVRSNPYTGGGDPVDIDVWVNIDNGSGGSRGVAYYLAIQDAQANPKAQSQGFGMYTFADVIHPYNSTTFRWRVYGLYPGNCIARLYAWVPDGHVGGMFLNGVDWEITDIGWQT